MPANVIRFTLEVTCHSGGDEDALRNMLRERASETFHTLGNGVSVRIIDDPIDAAPPKPRRKATKKATKKKATKKAAARKKSGRKKAGRR